MIRRGVRASGHDDDAAEALADGFLASRDAEPAAAAPVETLDPLHRHRLPEEPPAFDRLLDPAPGALPSPAGRSLEHAEKSPQTRFRRRGRGGASREARDRRRLRRREHDRKRMAALGDEIFARHGQVRDVPDAPALKNEVRGLNLRAMQDGTGAKARALVARLPYTQQIKIYGLAYAALPWARTGTLSQFRREDLTAAAPLPDDVEGRQRALELVRDEVTPTWWFRRLAAAAYAIWGHRGRPLSTKAQRAFRGAVYLVEGFCQGALSYLVPKADGTLWSRSALWGPTGSFALLCGIPRRIGREPSSPPGIGVFHRWQPAADAARFKGPTRRNPKTGALERWGLAQTRYDEEACGRTAASLARRGRGAVRAATRLLTAIMTPALVPQERKRRVAKRPIEDAEAAPVAEEVTQPSSARAPPQPG